MFAALYYSPVARACSEVLLEPDGLCFCCSSAIAVLMNARKCFSCLYRCYKYTCWPKRSVCFHAQTTKEWLTHTPVGVCWVRSFRSYTTLCVLDVHMQHLSPVSVMVSLQQFYISEPVLLSKDVCNSYFLGSELCINTREREIRTDRVFTPPPSNEKYTRQSR